MTKLKYILTATLIGIASRVHGQVVVGNFGVQYVFSAPSGSCSSNAPIQVVVGTGFIYSCQSGTWGQVGSTSGTGFPITVGSTTVTSGSTTTSISGLTLVAPSFGTSATFSFITGSTQCLHVNSSGQISGTGGDCGAGGGVSSVSVGNLSPLFTASVSNPTTTPAISFTIANAAQGSIFAGPTSGGSGSPTFQSVLPTAAVPAFTGDMTNSAGSLATTVGALENISLPTFSGTTGDFVDTSGVLGLTAPVFHIDKYAGADWCAKLSAALTAANTLYGNYRGTFDGRAFSTGQSCAANPFVNLPTNASEAGIVVLAPPVSITVNATISTSANDVVIRCTGTGGAGGFYAGASLGASNPIFAFGSTTARASGERIEDCRVDANSGNVTGSVVTYTATQEFSGALRTLFKGGNSASTTTPLVSCINCNNMDFEDTEFLAAGDNYGLSFTYNAGDTGNPQESNLIKRSTFNNTGLNTGLSAINFGSSTNQAWSHIIGEHAEGFANAINIASGNSITWESVDMTGSTTVTDVVIASGGKGSGSGLRDNSSAGGVNLLTDANYSLTLVKTSYTFANGGIIPFYNDGVVSTGDAITTGALTASGTITFTGIEAASGNYCLHISTTGVVTNTGSDCGSGGSTALSSITAASAGNTIASGNHSGQVWNWALTANSEVAFTFGETSAATSGTLGNQYILEASTAAGSTAVPLNVTDSLTGSQTLPALHITPIWNTSGVVDAALLVNVTNTASGAASLIMDLQIGGTSEFKVDKAGNATATTSLAAGNPTGGVGSSIFLTQEGTVPSGLSASGQDNCYADSTQHGLLCNFNAGSTLPLVQGPTSNTTLDLAEFSGTNGGKIIDSNILTANVVTASSNFASNRLILGGGANKTLTSVAGLTTDGTSVLTLGVAGTSAGGVTFDNATSGSIAVAPPTGALGSVTATLFDATGTFVGQASTTTTANKIVQSTTTAGMTANNDFPERFYFPAANCNNTTAGAGWSIGSGGTVVCRAGTNNLGGAVQITDTSSTFAQFTTMIPEDWNTSVNPYIRFYFSLVSDTTNGHTVIPQIKVSCPTANNGTTSDDASFSAAQSSSTFTIGASGVANGFVGTSNVQIGSTQMTGCIAGGMMIVQVGRATDTVTGNVNFWGAGLTFPRDPSVQAD